MCPIPAEFKEELVTFLKQNTINIFSRKINKQKMYDQQRQNFYPNS